MPEKFEQSIVKKEKLSPIIEELRFPSKEILKEIKDLINKGEYKTIIGDDSSGRIPTLVLDSVIKNIYKDKGFESPQVLFMATNRNGGNEFDSIKEQKKIKEFFEHYLDREKFKNGKILISTDTIISGGSLRPLTKVLNEYNISYDISTYLLITENEDIFKYLQNTLEYDKNSSVEEQKEKLEETRLNEIKNLNLGKIEQIHVAETGLYGVHNMGVWMEKNPDFIDEDCVINSSGTHKNQIFHDIISQSTYKSYDSDTKEDKRFNKAGIEKVKKAREEIKILSDQLTDWYRKNLGK